METIKCKECGCIMGTASEVCPVCGAPVENQEEVKIERQTQVQEEVTATEQPQQSELQTIFASLEEDVRNNLKYPQENNSNGQGIMTEKELRRFGLAASMLSEIVGHPHIAEIEQEQEELLTVAFSNMIKGHFDNYELYQASCTAKCLNDALFCDPEVLKGYFYQDFKNDFKKKVPYSITDLAKLVKEYNEKGQKKGIVLITIDTENKQANLQFGWQQTGAHNLFHILSYGPMAKRFDIIYGLCMKFGFEIN